MRTRRRAIQTPRAAISRLGAAKWYDLFSRGARDWLRHDEKVRESVRKHLPQIVSGGDVINEGARTVRVPVACWSTITSGCAARRKAGRGPGHRCPWAPARLVLPRSNRRQPPHRDCLRLSARSALLPAGTGMRPVLGEPLLVGGGQMIGGLPGIERRRYPRIDPDIGRRQYAIPSNAAATRSVVHACRDEGRDHHHNTSARSAQGSCIASRGDGNPARMRLIEASVRARCACHNASATGSWVARNLSARSQGDGECRRCDRAGLGPVHGWASGI